MRALLFTPLLLVACGQPFSSRCVVTTPVVATGGLTCTLVRDGCLNNTRYTIECTNGMCTCASNGTPGPTFVSESICSKDLSPQQDEFFVVACGYPVP